MGKNLVCAVLLLNVLTLAAAPEALVDLPLNEGDLKAIQDAAPAKTAVKLENPEFLVWADGPQGKALAFNNADGKVKRGRVMFKIPAQLDVAKGFSFACTFKTGKELLPKRIYPLLRYADAHQKSNGVFIFCFYRMIFVRTGVDGKQYEVRTNAAKTPLKADTWYRLVVTHDGTAVRIYVNGTLAAAGEAPTQKPKIHSFGMLGSTGDIYGYGFDGVLSQVKLFDRALTADEVTAMQTEE